MENLIILKNEAKKALTAARNPGAVKRLEKEYLGEKGKITLLIKNIKNLPEEEKKKQGRLVNELKSEIKEFIKERKNQLDKEQKEKSPQDQRLDVTHPGIRPQKGSFHLLTRVIREANAIFSQLGFSVVEGPEIETEWYNFDALNIPEEHPAREMWDTFWIKSQLLGFLSGSRRSREIADVERSETGDRWKGSNQKSQIPNLPARAFGSSRWQAGPKFQTNSKFQIPKLLLRTHTSPMQIRYMETHQPPLRIVVPGRCFRYEATDASHDIHFYQLEGLMLDKDISAAHFKDIIQAFFSRFFKKETVVRLRPGFFPFVEPGFEVDMKCIQCSGRDKGCSVCSGTGWLELLGAGMVHPNVLKNAGLNPRHWQGFAFGLGLDRLAMMKYKMPDIRLFYSGDLRFINQF